LDALNIVCKIKIYIIEKDYPYWRTKYFRFLATLGIYRNNWLSIFNRSAVKDYLKIDSQYNLVRFISVVKQKV